jgi:CPxCG-related zinc finger
VPGGSGPPERVRRIDLARGGSARSARAGEIRTLWATATREAVVPLSLVEGRRTRAFRLVLPPATVLEVGQPVAVEGQRLTIHGLRARGRTWSEVGDRFGAAEVDRIYARRYAIPPAGSSGWSTPRESPSSVARARSTAERSRSSPGESRARRSPPPANASGGATVHSSVPS